MEISEFEKVIFTFWRDLSADQMTVIACVLVGWLCCGLIGWGIGKYRGRPGLGFVLGAALSVIGWIIVAVLPSEGPKCPHCLGVVSEAARKCRHCGSDLYGYGELRVL